MSKEETLTRLTFVRNCLQKLSTNDENQKTLKREIIAIDKAIKIVRFNDFKERLFIIIWTTIFWTGFFLVASAIY